MPHSRLQGVKHKALLSLGEDPCNKVRTRIHKPRRLVPMHPMPCIPDGHRLMAGKQVVYEGLVHGANVVRVLTLDEEGFGQSGALYQRYGGKRQSRESQGFKFLRK